MQKDMERRENRKYGKNLCLTMHQPWASLLVHGIKRIEGRSWPAPIRGRLWIHAASKVPDDTTIKAMVDFYREIYAVDGINDLEFPASYPVSRLLGCIEVVGCLTSEELACWKMLPEGVRLEGLTKFCWLCEQPQRLSVPIEMRGYQGVYNLESKVFEAAMRDLVSAESPLPVKFPLPNPRDPFSLKPGSVSADLIESKVSPVVQSVSLNAAIGGARVAATQFLRKDQNFQTNTLHSMKTTTMVRSFQSKSKSTVEDHVNNAAIGKAGSPVSYGKGQAGYSRKYGYRGSSSKFFHADRIDHPGAHSKIFADAVKGLRSATCTSSIDSQAAQDLSQ